MNDGKSPGDAPPIPQLVIGEYQAGASDWTNLALRG